MLQSLQEKAVLAHKLPELIPDCITGFAHLHRELLTVECHACMTSANPQVPSAA